MPKTRKQKEETVVSLTEQIGTAGSVVFATFDKLKVVSERALRTSLRGKGVSYEVTKKNLLKRAIVEAKIPGEVPSLDGQVAIAYGADPLEPAKGVATFASANAGLLSIIGGIYEGKLVGKEMMEMLASIPSRETLLGMLLNVMSAPVRGIVIAVDAIATKRAN